MNGTGTEDRTDEDLRALLAQADPERGAPASDTDQLLARVRAEITSRPQSGPAQSTATSAPASATTQSPSWLHRHWQGALLVAAGVAALALAAPSVLPGLTGGAEQESTASAGLSEFAPGDPETADRLAAAEPGAGPAPLGADSATESGADASVGSSGTSLQTQDAAQASLVRSASVLVGTDEIEAERETFVATILGLGGRVTSETVVTEGSGRDLGVGTQMLTDQDLAMSSPGFPWYPTGPGVWLSVEVPAANYERAVAAARGAGDVVRSEQSSYDVGTQIADVDARIAALEASVARLTDLMAQADGVSEVIKLEQAISTRQAELDALGARQRELANQTEMSRVSLTLMSPEDARGAVDPDPEPPRTWWESLLAGLGQFWEWLGRALLIVSPLLIAAGIIWWVRRRTARSAAHPTRPSTPEPPASDTGA